MPIVNEQTLTFIGLGGRRLLVFRFSFDGPWHFWLEPGVCDTFEELVGQEETMEAVLEQVRIRRKCVVQGEFVNREVA